MIGNHEDDYILNCVKVQKILQSPPLFKKQNLQQIINNSFPAFLITYVQK